MVFLPVVYFALYLFSPNLLKAVMVLAKKQNLCSTLRMVLYPGMISTTLHYHKPKVNMMDAGLLTMEIIHRVLPALTLLRSGHPKYWKYLTAPVTMLLRLLQRILSTL